MELFEVISTDETTCLIVGDVVKKVSKSDVFGDCIIIEVTDSTDKDAIGIFQHISADMLKKL